MKGISKDELIEVRKGLLSEGLNTDVIDALITLKVKELQEPWIPVDENAPKDRFILCFIDDLQSKYILKFSTIRNTWLDQGLRPFMEPDLYQELPDDPIMPIHKPEPPR